MALPTLDATFASSADLPRKQMLAKWLVEELGLGSIADYWTLPERYLWAKIAVAAGGPKTEADYIFLPKNYAWSDIYNAVAGSSGNHTDWSENVALGHIAAAYRGDTGNPANLATYIDWPWRYQVAAIIDGVIDNDVESFIALSGATDRDNLNAFVKGIKALGLWDSMVCWPLRSSQNTGTGTAVYSLGGFGTFNGTMVNGPTWESNGINFDGSNDHITLPNGSFGTGSNPIGVWAFLKNDTTAAIMVPMATGDHNGAENAFNITSPLSIGVNDGAGAAFTNLAIGATSTAWKCLLSGHDSSLLYGGRNGGGVSSTALLNTINKNGQACGIGFLRQPPLYYFDGLISAVIRINATPTTSLNNEIYSLYRSTLGAGLGLP